MNYFISELLDIVISQVTDQKIILKVLAPIIKLRFVNSTDSARFHKILGILDSQKDYTTLQILIHTVNLENIEM